MNVKYSFRLPGHDRIFGSFWKIKVLIARKKPLIDSLQKLDLRRFEEACIEGGWESLSWGLYK